MELIQINQKILNACEMLQKGNELITKLTRSCAEHQAEYDVSLAREIARLLDEGKPATVAEKLAKGNISDIKKAYDESQYMWDGAKLKMRSLETQISGYQSILKYQGEV